MAHHRDIIPEDGAIRVLVEILGFSNPNHANGISTALSKVNTYFDKRFAVVIIDDDKRKPKLFDQYRLTLRQEYGLQLRQKPESLHFLILISPAIEDWLLENARAIDVVFAGLETRKDLMRITKDELEVEKNPLFRKYLNDLKQKQAPGFKSMSGWIHELREKHAW